MTDRNSRPRIKPRSAEPGTAEAIAEDYRDIRYSGGFVVATPESLQGSLSCLNDSDDSDDSEVRTRYVLQVLEAVLYELRDMAATEWAFKRVNNEESPDHARRYAALSSLCALMTDSRSTAGQVTDIREETLAECGLLTTSDKTLLRWEDRIIRDECAPTAFQMIVSGGYTVPHTRRQFNVSDDAIAAAVAFWRCVATLVLELEGELYEAIKCGHHPVAGIGTNILFGDPDRRSKEARNRKAHFDSNLGETRAHLKKAIAAAAVLDVVAHWCANAQGILDLWIGRLRFRGDDARVLSDLFSYSWRDLRAILDQFLGRSLRASLRSQSLDVEIRIPPSSELRHTSLLFPELVVTEPNTLKQIISGLSTAMADGPVERALQELIELVFECDTTCRLYNEDRVRRERTHDPNRCSLHDFICDLEVTIESRMQRNFVVNHISTVREFRQRYAIGSGDQMQDVRSRRIPYR